MTYVQRESDSWVRRNSGITTQHARQIRFLKSYKNRYGLENAEAIRATSAQGQLEYWHYQIDGKKIWLDPHFDEGCCVCRLHWQETGGGPGVLQGKADVIAYQLAGGYVVYSRERMVEHLLEKGVPKYLNTHAPMSRLEWHAAPTDAWHSGYWNSDKDNMFHIRDVYRYMYVSDVLAAAFGEFIEDTQDELE